MLGKYNKKQKVPNYHDLQKKINIDQHLSLLRSKDEQNRKFLRAKVCKIELATILKLKILHF